MRLTEAPLPEIRLVDLEKRFRDVVAVDGVSLRIETGEFFSLLGPSRLRQDHDAADDRRLRAADRRAGSCCAAATSPRDPPDKRPVNMVFQNYALFPHLDVGDNVAFGLDAARASPRPRSRGGSARRSSSSTSTGYEQRKPNQLSGGQQQRVALARALVNRPNVLLLDEPLGALDLKLRRQLQVELKRIQAEVGITFVYVTHDQEEALTMSDRIAVMNARPGRAARARPRSSTSGPATRFVADFIGTTNLLRGTVEAATAASALSARARRVARRRRTTAWPPGSRVEISVRPEADHARAPARDAGADRGATVEQAAYLGTTISVPASARPADWP